MDWPSRSPRHFRRSACSPRHLPCLPVVASDRCSSCCRISLLVAPRCSALPASASQVLCGGVEENDSLAKEIQTLGAIKSCPSPPSTFLSRLNTTGDGEAHLPHFSLCALRLPFAFDRRAFALDKSSSHTILASPTEIGIETAERDWQRACTGPSAAQSSRLCNRIFASILQRHCHGIRVWNTLEAT